MAVEQKDGVSGSFKNGQRKKEKESVWGRLGEAEKSGKEIQKIQ